jgi:hypothetical protein
MAVLEDGERLYLGCELWVGSVRVTHPPPPPKAINLGQMWVTMAIPSIKHLSGGRGKGWSGEEATTRARVTRRAGCALLGR